MFASDLKVIARASQYSEFAPALSPDWKIGEIVSFARQFVFLHSDFDKFLQVERVGCSSCFDYEYMGEAYRIVHENMSISSDNIFFDYSKKWLTFYEIPANDANRESYMLVGKFISETGEYIALIYALLDETLFH